MAAGDCLLPDTCSAKCGNGFLPFFEGGCFDGTLAQMTGTMASDFLRFGDLCADNSAQCPWAELAARVAEVTAACTAGGHRRNQAVGTTLGALPESCSPDCAAVYADFYTDCFETASLDGLHGSAALYVRCARLNQAIALSSDAQQGCSVHTDCEPNDLVSRKLKAIPPQLDLLGINVAEQLLVFSGPDLRSRRRLPGVCFRFQSRHP